MTKHRGLEEQRFGKLVAKSQTTDILLTKNGNPIKGIKYYCDCDCGTKDVLALASALALKQKMSCGCNGPGGRNIKDLLGKRFGNLLVVGRVKNNKTTDALWQCLCDCGNTTHVIGISLRNGTKSCGCFSRLNPNSNILGKRFGNLLVVGRASNTSRGLARWYCDCDCGTKDVLVSGSTLRKGNRKSCGCLTKRTKPVWKGVGDMPGSYYTKIKTGAKSRCFEFAISKRYMWYIYISQNKKCSLTGMDISFKMKQPSLDRIDSSIGYIEGNVQWVHKDINKMKLAHSQDYFIKLCKMVTENAITSNSRTIS